MSYRNGVLLAAAVMCVTYLVLLFVGAPWLVGLVLTPCAGSVTMSLMYAAAWARMQGVIRRYDAAVRLTRETLNGGAHVVSVWEVASVLDDPDLRQHAARIWYEQLMADRGLRDD